jgi:hypothetical protein
VASEQRSPAHWIAAGLRRSHGFGRWEHPPEKFIAPLGYKQFDVKLSQRKGTLREILAGGVVTSLFIKGRLT